MSIPIIKPEYVEEYQYRLTERLAILGYHDPYKDIPAIILEDVIATTTLEVLRIQQQNETRLHHK